MTQGRIESAQLHRAAALAAGHRVSGTFAPTTQAARESDPEGFDYLVWMYQVRPWMVIRRLPVRCPNEWPESQHLTQFIAYWQPREMDPITRLLWESEAIAEGYESLHASTRVVGWESTSLWDHFSEGAPF